MVTKTVPVQYLLTHRVVRTANGCYLKSTYTTILLVSKSLAKVTVSWLSDKKIVVAVRKNNVAHLPEKQRVIVVVPTARPIKQTQHNPWTLGTSHKNEEVVATQLTQTQREQPRSKDVVLVKTVVVRVVQLQRPCLDIRPTVWQLAGRKVPLTVATPEDTLPTAWPKQPVTVMPAVPIAPAVAVVHSTVKRPFPVELNTEPLIKQVNGPKRANPLPLNTDTPRQVVKQNTASPPIKVRSEPRQKIIKTGHAPLTSGLVALGRSSDMPLVTQT